MDYFSFLAWDIRCVCVCVYFFDLSYVRLDILGAATVVAGRLFHLASLSYLKNLAFQCCADFVFCVCPKLAFAFFHCFFISSFHDILRLYLWCGIELNKQQQQRKSTLRKYQLKKITICV